VLIELCAALLALVLGRIMDPFQSKNNQWMPNVHSTKTIVTLTLFSMAGDGRPTLMATALAGRTAVKIRRLKIEETDIFWKTAKIKT
jgi:hypothetical protein